MAEKIKTKIWDSPTRIFHWALVINIFAAWYTIDNRMIEQHEIAGYTLIVLIIFRLTWGLIGSTTARFKHFLTSPLNALGYLKLSLRQKSHHEIGHNPAGGWMIIFMLLIISLQVITGLFANNDLGFSGALSDYVSKNMSDLLTQIHQLNFDILMVLIWVHLVAVFFYVLVKKDNLIKAMFTGRKLVKEPVKNSLYFASPLLAIFVACVGMSIVLWLALTK